MRKHLNKALFIILVLCAHIPVKAQQGKDPQPMNAFIGALMKKMTLNEKLGQLNLITPFLKTGPFATKKAFEKLKDGSAGNVYGVIGTPSGVHSKLVLADSTRLKIPLLSGLDIIHGRVFFMETVIALHLVIKADNVHSFRNIHWSKQASIHRCCNRTCGI